jgi:glutamate transport system substrate-binding protein
MIDAYSNPSQTNRWRRTLTAVCLTAMLVLAGAATCADTDEPNESVESLRADSPTLRNKERMRIGVRATVPLMGYQESGTGKRSGFEVELAKALARELGYTTEDKIEWVTVATVAERITALQSGRVDMVLANLSMTEDREKLVNFAGPYMLVPQAVMVHRDRIKKLETIADLRAPGVKVCTGTASTSEKALKEHGITPYPVDSNTLCIAGLRSREYDAYSTDLPIIAGFAHEEPKTFEILTLTFGLDERIGIALPDGDEALRRLVKHFLNRWQQQSLAGESTPWLRAYDRTIGQALEDPRYRSQPRVDDPPDLADHDSKAPR